MIYRLIVMLLLILLVVSVRAGDRVYKVQGISMVPQLMPGDRVVISETQEQEYQRGDLVAITFGHRQAPLIKRVVAVPGDQLAAENGKLLVNGQVISQIESAWMNSTLAQLARCGWIIPPENLFVLGDNPQNSRDSRRLGLIPYGLVIGKAVKVVKTTSEHANQQRVLNEY